MIIKQESDDDEGHDQIDASTIEVISCIIPKIQDILVNPPEALATIPSVYDGKEKMPLGSERLKAVELLY
jgi:hypothetical protein